MNSETGCKRLYNQASLQESIKVATTLTSLSDLSNPIVCRSMASTIVQQLQAGGETTQSCLLKLAKFFRAKSTLLMEQAEKLDEAALGESFNFHGLCNIEDAYLRNTIVHSVGKTQNLILKSHEKLDAMENSILEEKEKNDKDHKIEIYDTERRKRDANNNQGHSKRRKRVRIK